MALSFLPLAILVYRVEVTGRISGVIEKTIRDFLFVPINYALLCLGLV